MCHPGSWVMTLVELIGHNVGCDAADWPVTMESQLPVAIARRQRLISSWAADVKFSTGVVR